VRPHAAHTPWKECKLKGGSHPAKPNERSRCPEYVFAVDTNLHVHVLNPIIGRYALRLESHFFPRILNSVLCHMCRLYDEMNDSGDDDEDEVGTEGTSVTSGTAEEESEIDASMSDGEASSPKVNPTRTRAMQIHLFSSAQVEAGGSRQL